MNKVFKILASNENDGKAFICTTFCIKNAFQLSAREHWTFWDGVCEWSEVVVAFWTLHLLNCASNRLAPPTTWQKEHCKSIYFDLFQVIARVFHTILVRNVPKFSMENLNAARRFITMIDTFYDQKVREKRCRKEEFIFRRASSFPLPLCQTNYSRLNQRKRTKGTCPIWRLKKWRVSSPWTMPLPLAWRRCSHAIALSPDSCKCRQKNIGKLEGRDRMKLIYQFVDAF